MRSNVINCHVFAARRNASEVFAVVVYPSVSVCLSVCLSVRHNTALYQNR